MSILEAPVRQDSMEQEIPGAERTLAEALLRLRPALTRRAHAIVRNGSDAEDVVQETAFRAWHARTTLRAGVDPAPWLHTIVTRVAIDFARKEQRRSRTSFAETSTTVRSAEEHFVQGEAVAAVREAALRLGSGQQRVLVLHDVVGMSSREIASLDKVPHSTVRTRLRRARASVRNQLRGAM
jgi:RNA polymerase sigma-70 factor, ECF subfamily